MGFSEDIKRTLFSWATRLAMRRPSPNAIPLSGDLNERNYFSVYLGDENDLRRFLVESVDKNGVNGFWFNEGEQGAIRALNRPGIAGGSNF